VSGTSAARPTAYEVRPIASVESTRREATDDGWDDERSVIVLDPTYGTEALHGLAVFSHLDVVYVFDRVPVNAVERGARHPRGNPDWPEVGIFAQRAKNRPNRLGVTTCAIEGVDGRRIMVRGLDAIDGTPVLDLKPYMVEFAARGAVRQPPWSTELMRDYWTASH
jgi:tRNA-Thr(GGU) m(6)t(6)A37 methyltransferase TsaA